MRKLSGLVCGLALVAGTGVRAQEVIQETQTTTAPGTPVATETRRVSQILGSTVRLDGNNNFGTVNDIVLDRNGGIAYLVVSNSGRYAMLPWSAGNMNWGNRFVTYNVAPQAIQPLYFERGAWPNIYESGFTNRMRQVFPNAAVHREVLRPVPGAAPAPAGTAVPAPAPGVVKERITPRGDVKIKERIK